MQCPPEQDDPNGERKSGLNARGIVFRAEHERGPLRRDAGRELD